MSTTKHTPTPWHLHKRTEIICNLEDPMNGPIAATDYLGESERDAANAARIVQCVNACEGIEDPAALIAAVRECALFWAHGKPVHAGSEIAEQLLAVFRPLFNADDLRALGG